MDPPLLRALTDKIYEKRKAAALDVEKLVRESDKPKAEAIINQLAEAALSPNSNSRSGGVMGLAGCSIALGNQIVYHIDSIAPPILSCFNDHDQKVRYYACESMYNVAKVAKGEILVYFNELFDALSRLASDNELPVKNGCELLDRLIKDIVTEQASTYVSVGSYGSDDEDDYYQDHKEGKYESEANTGAKEDDEGINAPVDYPNDHHTPSTTVKAQNTNRHPHKRETAFSLERFIPLLKERMGVINAHTRTFLVSWLFVLHNVPELELVSFLPEFLDGLLTFLGDANVDIRTSTQTLLREFLHEIQLIAASSKSIQRDRRNNTIAENLEDRADEESGSRSLTTTTTTTVKAKSSLKQSESSADDDESQHKQQQQQGQHLSESVSSINDEQQAKLKDDYDGEGVEDLEDSGIWTLDQSMTVDQAAIVHTLLKHIDDPDEDIQATCLHWLSAFINYFPDAMVPLAPQIVPFPLKHLAHKNASIKEAAVATNSALFRIVQSLPVEPDPLGSNQTPTPSATSSPEVSTNVPLSTSASAASSTATSGTNATTATSPPTSAHPSSNEQQQPQQSGQQAGSGAGSGTASSTTTSVPFPPISRASSYVSSIDKLIQPSPSKVTTFKGKDPFDYSAILNALTHQFLAPSSETRVAALKWLQMLHVKAPRRVLPKIDDSLSLLLATLSDASEVVVKADLKLLAQISSLSAENYFGEFMRKLCQLFSTDRRILEERGSLIIVTLCTCLNTERIFRAFAEILEKDEDLEFASIMVQNLNVILITAPELSDFRKRLKNLETKDGQILFSILYRSWSHNAVATFTLCLLAQAYEHASNLLNIFAELEITVGLLIQIDKLVQLLESPIFTSLRLQLLEPEKYPFLLKSLYGLLMLLPQSSAFVTLKNRLNAVSALGFMHLSPRASQVSSSSSQQGRSRRTDDIKWNDLLHHFRAVQQKHERARKGALQNASFDDDNVIPSTMSTPGTVSPPYGANQSVGGYGQAGPKQQGQNRRRMAQPHAQQPYAQHSTYSSFMGRGNAVSSAPQSKNASSRPVSPPATAFGAQSRKQRSTTRKQ